MPPGVLCRAVQELHRCLASVIQNGDMDDLKMLDMAEKDPMVPASERRALSPMPRVEPWVGVNALSELSTSEPEKATGPEKLILVSRWRPPPPPSFSLQWADESNSSPQEQADWPWVFPRIPTWFCLLVVHTGEYLTFSSDGPGALWIPIQDHCPDIPDPGAPTILPRPHSQISLTLRKKSEQTQCSLPNPWLTLLLLDS